MGGSSRQVIYWDRIKGLRAWSSVAISTALGAGFFPKAPGTAGTLVAVPLAYWVAGAPLGLKLALWAALTAAGVWAAKVFDEIMGTGDNQHIVMDEVVGLGITALSISPDADWKSWLAAFVTFRAFDILKPPPVRQVDNWSRNRALRSSKHGSYWGGFGVMADDVLAGAQGLLVMLALQWLHVL